MTVATMTVRAFHSAREALDALRDAEYREFLRDCGCPSEQIDGEVEKLRQECAR